MIITFSSLNKIVDVREIDKNESVEQVRHCYFFSVVTFRRSSDND